MCAGTVIKVSITERGGRRYKSIFPVGQLIKCYNSYICVHRFDILLRDVIRGNVPGVEPRPHCLKTSHRRRHHHRPCL